MGWGSGWDRREKLVARVEAFANDCHGADGRFCEGHAGYAHPYATEYGAAKNKLIDKYAKLPDDKSKAEFVQKLSLTSLKSLVTYYDGAQVKNISKTDKGQYELTLAAHTGEDRSRWEPRDVEIPEQKKLIPETEIRRNALWWLNGRR